MRFAGTNLQLSSDGLLTFRISELTEFVDQPHSTTTMNVNPFNVSNWLGTINLRQDSLSTWYDTTTRPVVKVNSEGKMTTGKLPLLTDFVDSEHSGTLEHKLVWY